MRIILPLLFIFLNLSAIGEESFLLSQNSKISIITCAPGNEIFDCFGHTAIRVLDPATKMDIVFNYGIYEFNQPNFELNFAKGYMKYKLGISYFDRFTPVYTRDNRTITEQVLNLDSAQRQQFFDFLVWNEKPENKYYFYDYFYDNCATRVRDVIATKTGADVVYRDSFAANEGASIRQLVRGYAHNNLWGMLGIDFCLGQKIDREIDDSVYIFLPEYFLASLDHALIDGQPLVKSKNIIHRGIPRESTPWTAAPTTWFWLISLILFGLSQIKTMPTFANDVDIFLFGASGFMGCFALSLWMFTDHETTSLNFNLLWALPLNVLLPFLPQRIKAKYFLVYSTVLALLLVNWFWLPQELNAAFFPVILLLAYRAFMGYKRLK